MIPTEKRGWGAAQGKNKPDKIVDRYGISPQLAPSRMTTADKACLNSPIVGTPQSQRK
jgi:hypothetical protein